MGVTVGNSIYIIGDYGGGGDYTASISGQITAVSRGLALIQTEFEGETHHIYVRVN